jgi:hypothetical protein
VPPCGLLEELICLLRRDLGSAEQQYRRNDIVMAVPKQQQEGCSEHALRWLSRTKNKVDTHGVASSTRNLAEIGVR